MNSIIYSANIIMPIFIIILIGMISRNKGLIDENFINKSSKVVFTLALPSSIFITIYKSDFSSIFNPTLILVIVGSTFIGFILTNLTKKLYCTDKKQFGAFLQASNRGNLAIFGIAIIDRALSAESVALAASLFVFMIPLYNFIAVIALTGEDESANRKERLKKQAINITLNPLIIAIVLGAICSLIKVKLPSLIEVSFSYLAKMTLPLALLGIGGTLKLQGLKKRWVPTLGTAINKLIFIPLLTLLVAYLFNVKGENLALIMILTGSPVAVSSFAMANALKNDTELTADSITITTLLSIVTIGGGLAILKQLGII